MEDETALSIIDPVTLNMDVNPEKTLEVSFFHSEQKLLLPKDYFQVQLHLLTIRLSYYDMRMFLQMLNSLPKQMLTGNRSNTSETTPQNGNMSY